MALDGLMLSLHALVDTHEADLAAWAHAFATEGFALPPDRLGAALISDPEDVVFVLLGAKVEATKGARLRVARHAAFLAHLKAHPVSPAPGAKELLGAVHRRGIETALVGVADAEELAAIEQVSGVPWSRELDVLALPAESLPRSLARALALLGMTPAQCALLGSARSDAWAGAHAGLVTMATTHGRGAKSALRRAGARVAVADLRSLSGSSSGASALGLERTLRVVSPAGIRFDAETTEGLMRAALELAEHNLSQCRAPSGAVVASGAGVIVARGRDLSDTHGALAHAEMEALRVASSHVRPGEGAILATTSAPCAMCLQAAVACGIDTVLYGVPGPRRPSSLLLGARLEKAMVVPRIVGGILEDACAALCARFRAADESGSRLRGEDDERRTAERARAAK